LVISETSAVVDAVALTDIVDVIIKTFKNHINYSISVP